MKTYKITNKTFKLLDPIYRQSCDVIIGNEELLKKWYKKIVSRVRTNNVESGNLNLKSGWEAHIDKVYPDYYFEFRKHL